MKKKQITLTMEEWYEILIWCETYYHEFYYDEGTPEREKEEKEYNFYWNTINKLRTKLEK
jgi:hypothetical protein